MTIQVNAVLTHALKPYPEEIEQRENQLVVLTVNQYVATPYTTKTPVRCRVGCRAWLRLPLGSSHCTVGRWQAGPRGGTGPRTLLSVPG